MRLLEIGMTRIPLWRYLGAALLGAVFYGLALSFMTLAMHYQYPGDTFQWPFFFGAIWMWVFDLALTGRYISHLQRQRDAARETLREQTARVQRVLTQHK